VHDLDRPEHPAGPPEPPATVAAGEDPGAPTPAAPAGVSPLVTVAIALIAGLVGLTLGATVMAPETEAASPIAEAGRPTLGPADAPVKIAVYSDFGCPYCQQHDQDVEPGLIDDYVRDGQVRLEWHDVPFQGEASMRLAIAARAAHEQDRFWPFKEAAFGTDGRDASPERLRSLASEAGLDVERFERDLEDPALELAVRRDQQQAMEIGVRATPAFVVGDQALIGLQPRSAFDEALEDLLPG
jgi:protein-disulfide isomerase